MRSVGRSDRAMVSRFAIRVTLGLRLSVLGRLGYLGYHGYHGHHAARRCSPRVVPRRPESESPRVTTRQSGHPPEVGRNSCAMRGDDSTGNRPVRDRPRADGKRRGPERNEPPTSRSSSASRTCASSPGDHPATAWTWPGRDDAGRDCTSPRRGVGSEVRSRLPRCAVGTRVYRERSER